MGDHRPEDGVGSLCNALGGGGICPFCLRQQGLGKPEADIVADILVLPGLIIGPDDGARWEVVEKIGGCFGFCLHAQVCRGWPVIDPRVAWPGVNVGNGRVTKRRCQI